MFNIDYSDIKHQYREMDIEQARTFLAVTLTGSFVSAASMLHVTQSTVSTRIKVLEQILGISLFVRNRSGATLTSAGRRFRKHATLLVRTAEQAKHDVGLPEGFQASIVLGARLGLWDGLLLDWLGQQQRVFPDISIRAEIGFEADLMQGLIDGRIDAAVMYTPQQRPNLELVHLFDEQLILVASPGTVPDVRNYVLVDWGPEFLAQHNASFPELASPSLSVNVGWLGLKHILKAGGAGYFPQRLVNRHIESAMLVRISDAPEFKLPVWLTHPKVRVGASINPILDSLGGHAHT